MPLFSKQKIALMIAEFFYCGRSKWAPGTIGSLGSLVIWIPALYFFSSIYKNFFVNFFVYFRFMGEFLCHSLL
jgi:phosphatidylglycerophosphatase A